jgi:hypothetical protein
MLRHCERRSKNGVASQAHGEAIQATRSASAVLDCFAAETDIARRFAPPCWLLAMTGRRGSP